MDLRQAEYFLAVVEHGTITRAAQALYIAQPSLSQAIRALETDLGVTLFDRSPRRLTLTAHGAAFEGPARELLAGVAHAEAKVAAVRQLAAGRLSIAVVATLVIDPLPQLTAAFQAAHPGVLVDVLDPGSPAEAADQVRRGRVELAMTTLPVRVDALVVRELWEHEIVLALPAALAADLPDPVPIAAIGDISLVLEFSGTTGRAPIDDDLDHAIGTVAVECAHRQAIWELVRHGAGATLLPRQLAERELPDVVIRSIDPPVHRTVGLVQRPGPLSPAAAAFIAVLDEHHTPAWTRASSRNAAPGSDSAAGSYTSP